MVTLYTVFSCETDIRRGKMKPDVESFTFVLAARKLQ